VLLHAAAAALPFATCALALLGAFASALLLVVLVLGASLVLDALAAAGARSSTSVAIGLPHRHARHKAAAKRGGWRLVI
jgi:hypothetical protein